LSAKVDSPTRASAASTRDCAVAASPASFSGSRTFAATVAQGISVGSWNTKPSRTGAAPSSGCDQLISPRPGALRPAVTRSAVDLPQPEGPSSDTNSPGRTSRSRRSSATIPLAKVLPTPRNATTAAPDETGGAAGSTDTLQYRVIGGSVGPYNEFELPRTRLLPGSRALLSRAHSVHLLWKTLWTTRRARADLSRGALWYLIRPHLGT